MTGTLAAAEAAYRKALATEEARLDDWDEAINAHDAAKGPAAEAADAAEEEAHLAYERAQGITAVARIARDRALAQQ